MKSKQPITQQNGQALVEFALVLPILLLLIFGIIDFGRLFTAYAMASSSLRDAARHAATVGQIGTLRYLDCDSMIEAAQNVWFLSSQTIIITYIKADDPTTTYTCDTVSEEVLENGDLLELVTTNTVRPLTPIISSLVPEVTLEFRAQRTIIKNIEIGSDDSSEDSEPDGLNDDWEQTYFGNLDYSATDDPDGDGCNNGCEETLGGDPNNPDTDGDGLTDGDEVWRYGTDPTNPDTDGDGISDGEEVDLGTDPVGTDPVAVDDHMTTTVNTVAFVPVLNNDYALDYNALAISYVQTTTDNGGSASVHDNGTTTDTHDDFVVYTPPANWFGEDTFTYTISDGSGLLDSAIVTISIPDPSVPQPTPVPSPTPSDIVHNAPYSDVINHPEWWRINGGDVFLGYEDWNVKWYAWSGSTAEDARAAMNGIPACETAQPYDQDINFRWEQGGPAPGGNCYGDPWRTDYFAVEWTRTFGLENDVTVYLLTIANEGIEVIIDDVLVSAISTWGLVSGEQYRSTPYTFTGGVEHTITVRYFEHTHSATVAFLIYDGSNDDRGVCDWTIHNEQSHTAPNAWSDSPGTVYSNDSLCHIALRGAVNLATLSSPPRMTFWERWRLANYDAAYLQIREYGVGGPWYQQLLHRGAVEQLAWTRQEIDLTSYSGIRSDTGQPFMGLDWTGKTIEFRFALQTDRSAADDGWWIDDIIIEGYDLNVYTVGYADNVEAGNFDWLPGGGWGITAEKAHSGANAWSDSPYSYYPANAESILQLDGIVDLTDPVSVDPELVFYHSWDLGPNDRVFVEVSSNGSTWVSLTPNNPGGALRSGTTNLAFIREVISLNSQENPYQDTMFYLRFRLLSDGSGEGDGWWIDDVLLQNRGVGYLPYPFFDNVEAGPDYWVADGQWNITPEAAYSGNAAWTDSPDALYGQATEVSLQSALPFNLMAGSAVYPELSFWHRRDLGEADNFYVEVSTDGGATWQPVWSYLYSASTDSSTVAPGTPFVEFNRQHAWERVSVDMAAYINTPFLLRFRLDAMTGTQVADGIWIDDIRLAEHQETPHTVPFADDMEGSENWFAGGVWALSDEAVHGGAYAYADSPGDYYDDNTWSVLELADPVDLTNLTAADFPVLYWWDRFSLGQYDYARVQIATWLGPNWSDWSPWQEVDQQYYTATLSWDRRQVDLRPYIGQKIRVRFVLDALQNASTGDGWWIDDVSIALYQPQVVTYDAFNPTGASMGGWVPDGTWGIDALSLSWGSNTQSLGAGTWDVTFYDLEQYVAYKSGLACGGITDYQRGENALSGTSFAGIGPNNSTCEGDPTVFTPAVTATISEIDFDCGLNASPNPDGTCNTTPWKTNHDHMAILFSRSFTVDAASTYEFELVHNDGARLYIDGNAVIDQWADVNVAPSHTETASLFLNAGTHTIEVWYYENVNGSVIQLNVARPDYSYHDSPGADVTYHHLDNMSLTLDGQVLDMTGLNYPVLGWHDMIDLGNYDCVIAEVSLPYQAFDQWFEVYRQCLGSVGSWTPHMAQLRAPIEAGLGLNSGSLSFNGLLMTVRFRLDARVNTAVGDGWWIDSISISDAAPPVCYALSLSHAGSGSDPVASPTRSSGCPAGEYVAGQAITLTASPAAGWEMSGWSGTTNDASTSTSNTVTMPASAHTAGATYAELACDALPVGLHQETHAYITYTGTWLPYNNAAASGGSIRYTSTPTAVASFCINGSQLTIYRTKYSNRGPADVYIDGAYHSTMQNTSATLQWAVPEVFSGLGAGIHTVEIRNMSNAIIDLDAVRVD